MTQRKEVFILSPFELPDVQLALEAIKAGAFPVLHLGRNKEEGINELKKLSQKTGKPFGLCINTTVFGKIKLPSNVTKIILPYGMNVPSVDDNVEILYQVHSLKEAEEAVEKKATSVIIKGNEGAGHIANESSFIIFQKIIAKSQKNGTKVYIQGGAGVHSSAAFMALGAQGVILDSQVALFPECSVPKEIKNICEKLSGSETTIIENFRVLHRTNSPALPKNAKAKDIIPFLGGFDLSKNYLPMGQDITLSSDLVKDYKKLKRLVNAIHEAAYGHLKQAKELNIIGEGNSLAEDLGIKYPIAQGPMARVSDVPEFINNVSKAGALPFLAMSMMKAGTSSEVLKETSELLGDRPWGVGILGFAFPHILEEQTKHILANKPKVVLIAGGRPSQAKPFEKEGISVFLHVPSSILLDMYLKEGARNFVFEGRESGGHVGPLFSIVLWEKQINRLLKDDNKSSISVLFAGGIHDALSSAFVSIMSASLAAKGVKVGIQMGTSYLYTKEAVKSGAILEEYQKQLIENDHTILLEAAPGQETRSITSSFTKYFVKEKQRMISEGMDSKEIWVCLERLNLGRLRIAAKGTERRDEEILKLNTEDQRRKGLYMTGEVTALIDKVTTMSKLHSIVAEDNKELISKLADIPIPASAAKPLDIAIVGMECIFPDAKNLDEYWKNIFLRKDSVTEVPSSRWSSEIFYRPDSNDTDYVVSNKGGFIPTIDFDPVEFGMTPQSLASIEPVQLLSLYVAKRALEDAGYKNLAEVDLEDTSVIFGAEGATELASAYGIRAGIHHLYGEIPEAAKAALPRLNEDSFAGVLSNVISGRISNRLNLGGRNYTVDAACASSLAAVDLGCQELYSGRSNMVILGGADFHNGINDFLMFSCTYALSKKGYCASFSDEADGIALGEGIGVLVMKRLEDAERDGNKIYAVIKGVGGSSDGRSLGMTAPNRFGQIKALERAYENAGILPSQVGLIEAHGTGTTVGDKVELAALTDMFLDTGASVGQTHLGSVKTQIGHTKCTAGIAGMIKATLAVYHGIKPPTIHLNKPNAYYNEKTSPFVFNTVPGLWNDEKRIAGVSAFGFGGTNYHAVIENYQPQSASTKTSLQSWPSELFVFRGHTMKEAKEQMQKIKTLLDINSNVRLENLAYSLAVHSEKDIQISIVAASVQELLAKIDSANEDKKDFGVYYRDIKDGKIAFLFSGQGSQRVNMARDLFVAFPAMRRLLDENKEYEKIIFPETVFDDATLKAQQKTITDTRNAQPLLGMVDFAIADFLQNLGIEPDMVAGHSYGEVAALCFAGAFSPENLTSLSRERALSILNAVEKDNGKMAAISNVSEEELKELLKGEKEVWAVNYNSVKQTVLAGTTVGITAFVAKMAEKGIACKEINVACAFHSPLLAKSKDLYAKVLKKVAFKTPKVQVWSNTTAEVYPVKADEIKERLCEHLIKPVLFTKQVQNMYADGARIFIETGPGSVLIGLVQATLGNEVTTIQTENKGAEGVTYLLKALGQYLSTGRKINIESLFEGREVTVINIDEPELYKKSQTLWYINGHYAVPADGKMPKDGAYPITSPILSGMKSISENAGREDIMMEYLDGMKSMLQNQKEMIQNQRDVMLGYFGQVEPAPRRQVQSNVTEQEVIEEVVAEEVVADTNGAVPISSLTTEQIRNILVEAVSEKTGYPTDMLGLDMDLEADLSIDSIKRMEIIGALRDKLVFPQNLEATEGVLEKMTVIKTLNELTAWIEELGQLVVDAPAETTDDKKEDSEPTTATVIEDDEIVLNRICLGLAPYPIAEKTLSIKDQRFAITDDGGDDSFASRIKKQLEEQGATVDLITPADKLADYDGLIVLNISASQKNYSIKDLFDIVKSADMNKVKWIYTFSDVVGNVLNSKNTKGLKKLQGFPGLIKSLAHEHPNINFRVVESHADYNKDVLPSIVLDELSVKEFMPEIIYKGTERFHFSAKLEKVNTETSELELDKDSVILVLGGAQGITPQLVSQLSTDYPCNYILVGRSSQNTEDGDKYKSLKTKDEIRKHLISVEGMKVPAEIEKKLQSIFKTNQIAEAITKVETAGGKVTYKSVDVKNTKEFKAFVKDTLKEYGKIDGVIHAAGILDDKLFEQKDWKSFEQVYETKVNPLNVITDELLPDLKLLVMFSSVSSAFGNRGQSDYASGNSVLDLTALILSERKAKTRVVSFNWGPWKGAGMVNSSLENEFKKRGVGMIPLVEGGEFFANELKFGKQPAVLVMSGKSSEIENFLKG